MSAEAIGPSRPRAYVFTAASMRPPMKGELSSISHTSSLTSVSTSSESPELRPRSARRKTGIFSLRERMNRMRSRAAACGASGSFPSVQSTRTPWRPASERNSPRPSAALGAQATSISLSSSSDFSIRAARPSALEISRSSSMRRTRWRRILERRSIMGVEVFQLVCGDASTACVSACVGMVVVYHF